MANVVNAQGFQTLISSPGFQQLVPQILNSEAFKQQLIPQMLNANNLQQLMPALTNVTPDLNNLFSALMPVIMNAVTANLQHAKDQAPPQVQQSTQTETSPEQKPTTVEATVPTVTFSETTESKELLAKEIAAQFEVVEIESEKEPEPVAQPSPAVQEKKQEVKEETSTTSEPVQRASEPTQTPTPNTEPTPAPAPAPSPASIPEIPEQLVPAVRALVDMGFTDISRNLDLLEKHNGNLLRVIELCLGEVQD